MSVFALIPARSGSKGVQHKNIRLLGGRPLLEWSIAACKLASNIDRIIVSTDSPQYANLAQEMGAETPFLRPKEISGDESTDYEFIKHSLDWLSSRNEIPEYIVHIRPTTPFRNPEILNNAVQCFTSNGQATSLRSVHLMPESAYKMFEISSAGNLKRIAKNCSHLDEANNARQSYPETYVANGYVDVLSTEFILKNSLIHGDFVIPYITSQANEVDTEEDFDFLEYILSANYKIYANLFS